MLPNMLSHVFKHAELHEIKPGLPGYAPVTEERQEPKDSTRLINMALSCAELLLNHIRCNDARTMIAQALELQA